MTEGTDTGNATKKGVGAAGKRFRCPTCGTEVMTIKSGTGVVLCCGQPMVPR